MVDRRGNAPLLHPLPTGLILILPFRTSALKAYSPISKYLAACLAFSRLIILTFRRVKFKRRAQ